MATSPNWCHSFSKPACIPEPQQFSSKPQCSRQPLCSNHYIRLSSSLIVAGLFAICTVLLAIYKIHEPLSRQIARELAERRAKAAF